MEQISALIPELLAILLMLASLPRKCKDAESIIETYLMEFRELNFSTSSYSTFLDKISSYNNLCISRLNKSFDTIWMLDLGAIYYVTNNFEIISKIQLIIEVLMLNVVGQTHLVIKKDKAFV